ncbi:MAG: hypothetical protein IJP75_08450 [Bacteroidaceae bacterium]|nr:hypothetical protein [Bacteroidaceae bacterium]
MTNFKHMEIASTVAAHPNIYVKHGFLGFSTKVYYRPTLSEVDCIRKYYTIATGNALLQFLTKFPTNPQCAENTKLKMEFDPNGNYCMEMCSSRDHLFIALQLFRYSDLAYNAITEIFIFEGREAELLCHAIRK